MAQEYGKRAADLPIDQLQTDLGKLLATALPEDAAKNVPVAQAEAMAREALTKVGWLPIPDIKCRVVCKFVYPPGQVECVLACDIIF